MENKLKVYYKIITIILIITTIFFIGKTIYDCITLLNCDHCSAPWYTALLIDLTIFTIPLLLEIFIFLYLSKKISLYFSRWIFDIPKGNNHKIFQRNDISLTCLQIHIFQRFLP